MHRSTKNRISLLTILVLLLAFLLWPISNPAYEIDYSEEKIIQKRQFLEKKSAADSSSPNILIILADDLSIMDVSCYGGKNVQTKHIDHLAKNGVKFNNAYISSPICAPSRAGLLTGRYQQRFGFEINIHERYPKNRLEYFVYSKLMNTGDWIVADHEDWAVPSKEAMEKQGLPPSEILLSELLKKHGYATGCFGKWHLGYHEKNKPNNMGFDHHYGFYEAFSLYGLENQSNIINQKLDDFSDPHIWNKGRTGNCAIRINDSIVNEDEYLTNKIAKEASDWIIKHKNQKFFAYLPFSAPHTPFQITKNYYEQFNHIRDPKKRIYYAMIKALDDAVGTVIHTLDSLDLRKETIIFFLSDNGGATYTKAADNSPYKGGKFTNFEGGLKIPFIISWGNNFRNLEYSKAISSLDIFSTCAAICNAKLPDNIQYDGINLIPFLSDVKSKMPHDYLYWRSRNHKAIRSKRWKLIVDEKSQKEKLYDLEFDPTERNNVAALYPDTINALKSQYSNWEDELMDSRWPRVMDYQIKIDQDTFYFPL